MCPRWRRTWKNACPKDKGALARLRRAQVELEESLKFRFYRPERHELLLKNISAGREFGPVSDCVVILCIQERQLKLKVACVS